MPISLCVSPCSQHRAPPSPRRWHLTSKRPSVAVRGGRGVLRRTTVSRSPGDAACVYLPPQLYRLIGAGQFRGRPSASGWLYRGGCSEMRGAEKKYQKMREGGAEIVYEIRYHGITIRASGLRLWDCTMGAGKRQCHHPMDLCGKQCAAGGEW